MDTNEQFTPSESLEENLESYKSQLRQQLNTALQHALPGRLNKDGTIEELLKDGKNQANKLKGKSEDTKIYGSQEIKPNTVVIKAEHAMLFPWLYEEACKIVNSPENERRSLSKLKAKHEQLHMAASYDADTATDRIYGIAFYKGPFYQGNWKGAVPFMRYRQGFMTVEQYEKVVKAPHDDVPDGSDEIILDTIDSNKNLTKDTSSALDKLRLKIRKLFKQNL